MLFDINWKRYYAVQADFILAQLRGQEEALIAARDVLDMYSNGNVSTLGSIVDSFKPVFTTNAEYEAWVIVSESRYEGYLKRMTGVAREAFILLFKANIEDTITAFYDRDTVTLLKPRRQTLKAIEELKYIAMVGMHG